MSQNRRKDLRATPVTYTTYIEEIKPRFFFALVIFLIKQFQTIKAQKRAVKEIRPLFNLTLLEVNARMGNPYCIFQTALMTSLSALKNFATANHGENEVSI